MEWSCHCSKTRALFFCMEYGMSTRPPIEPPFLNRELSLLKFNERVLAMAENPKVPLLERLRYVCIVSSNLDEFFEIRISSLKEQQRQNPALVGPAGRTPGEAFERLQQAVHTLVDRRYTLDRQSTRLNSSH